MGLAETEAGVARGDGAVEGADGETRSLTAEERAAFLAYVEEHGREKGYSVNKACRAVGIRRKDVRAQFASDPEFDEDYQTAQGRGAEQILSQMVKLAIEGVPKAIVSGGQILGEELVYSERLLQTMFNGLTPEGKAMVLGRLGLEISGPNGGPIEVQAGVSLAGVARVLLTAGVDLKELAAGHEAAEIVAETDEPLDADRP